MFRVCTLELLALLRGLKGKEEDWALNEQQLMQDCARSAYQHVLQQLLFGAPVPLRSRL